MTPSPSTPAIAFHGTRRLAIGPLSQVALQAREARASDPSNLEPIFIFHQETSRQIELDLTASAEELLTRLADPIPAPRAVGRPKLGVVGREVTLLPRHWDWLAEQPGGASVALRKLVEEARRNYQEKDRLRAAQKSTYEFMLAMAGDAPGFEEANRALFGRNEAKFQEYTEGWPPDVRDHARSLAARAFATTE